MGWVPAHHASAPAFKKVSLVLPLQHQASAWLSTYSTSPKSQESITGVALPLHQIQVQTVSLSLSGTLLVGDRHHN